MSIKKVTGEIIAALLLLAIGAAGGYSLCLSLNTPKAEIVEKSNVNHLDLKLPGEVEKRIITKDEVEAKLIEIGQLATYFGEYTKEKHVDQSRYLLEDIRIPGTTNTISIKCRGIVKVGYDVHDITPTVDNESRTIYIALPEVSVLDNYVIWDSIEYAESNNILNPIDFEQYQILIDEIEQEGLKQVEGNGIYNAAEENVKTIIKNFLAGFDEYDVVFM